MKKLLTLFALSLVSFASAAHHEHGDADATWQIDPAHSQIDFWISHLGIAKIRGTFGEFSGSFSGLSGDMEDVKGTLTIQVESIDTGVEDRDNHLRNEDFFHVEEYPEMVFELTSVEAEDDGEVEFTGDLTLHGVTKEVTLDGEITEDTVTDPWGNTRRGVSVSGEINRKDFGITWNRTLDAGGVMLGETVKISGEFELIKQTED